MISTKQALAIVKLINAFEVAVKDAAFAGAMEPERAKDVKRWHRLIKARLMGRIQKITALPKEKKK